MAHAMDNIDSRMTYPLGHCCEVMEAAMDSARLFWLILGPEDLLQMLWAGRRVRFVGVVVAGLISSM